ncbi:MAG: prolyl oligopeptidase family serine peptidase, partial [Anaerolineales bacterium]|nr:prolyl oligopeptidase family serine peptidase [Anaerolineales bacterium]
ALVASSGDMPPRLITIQPDGKTEIIRLSSENPLPRNIFSLPRAISWENGGKLKIHGLFYPPLNPGFSGNGNPPLLIIIHSGPTRQKWAEFQPRTQYFTSRGFAVLEVNYRGSTGYGRDYCQAIQENWGLVDVEDCLSGATYVTNQGWADPENMFLLGSSSGGLTVYQSMVRYPGIFKAGITLYGIVNHLALLKNPPKFERHYSDWLIGPYPEAAELYHKRSPIFFADQIQDPIAIFQGGKDPIVPRDQADQIVSALKSNGIPYLYRLYPDEGHGFKGKDSLEDFYQQVEMFLQAQLKA